MSDESFIQRLTGVVGTRHVVSDARKSRRYRKGFRSGEGDALAVVFPGTLLEQWHVLQACVDADKIVIMQAANTGLTEGSTPKGNDYDRTVVIINTLRMDTIRLLKDGHQIVGFPGSTLYDLEKRLKPLGRKPHSEIGSSCIGASVIGGVCNNSGGALVKRGPAYTELALFAQVSESGDLQLINHLGINLGNSPEEILSRLEKGSFTEEDVVYDTRTASDADYSTRVRDVEAETPARFNADKTRLHETSGCAGKLAVFAVRLDTFPDVGEEQVFYIGTNTPAVLTDLRRTMLRDFENLPEAAEYMHRDIFDIARQYGKDTFLMIELLGTDRLPAIFSLKGWLDALPFLPENMVDRVMQAFSRLCPNRLPKRVLAFRQRYEHHLILKMSGPGIAEAERLLEAHFAENEGAYFTCSEAEGHKAFLHRFVAAGAAVRYQAVHASEVEDILALDIALPRNDRDWLETLPEEIENKLIAKLYYGHFMCHVFHQDYILKKGENAKKVKADMLALLDKRGAEYPAEHNVGHLYAAKPDLKEFYQEIDPTNAFNPGIGKTSKRKHYA
ncbi:MAG: D-lactate dehydrogenase [Stappiaceae bacterium]